MARLMEQGRVTRILLPVFGAAWRRGVNDGHPGETSSLSPPIYRTEVLFVFRVALSRAGRREALLPVMVDVATESPQSVLKLDRAITLPGAKPRDEKGLRYRLSRLYRVAVESLPKRIEETFRSQFERDAQAIAEERERIESYYHLLMAEEVLPVQQHFRMMATVSVYADLTTSPERHTAFTEQLEKLQQQTVQLERVYSENIERLNNEKEQRLKEMMKRHESTADVSLVQVAIVLVPAFRNADGDLERLKTVSKGDQ